MKYLIAGHYNLNNGDRAVLESTVQHIQRSDPDATIVVSAFRPDLLEDSRFSVVPWPVRQFRGAARLARICMTVGSPIPSALLDRQYLDVLRESDLVLVSGGHHLTDLVGTSTYYAMAAHYTVPLEHGAKVVLLPQTVGPFSGRGRATRLRLVGRVLAGASQIYLRDKNSVDFVRETLPDVRFSEVPDVVNGIDSPLRPVAARDLGLALYTSYVSEAGRARMRKVLDAVYELAVAATERGLRVCVIPMESAKYAKDDRPAASALIERFERVHPDRAGRFVIEEPENPDDILSTVAQFSSKELVVGCKTHSVVFAMASVRPVVAVGYQQKTLDFMNAASLGEYAVMDRDVDPERLQDLVWRAVADQDRIIEQERTYRAQCREALDRMFSSFVDGVER